MVDVSDGLFIIISIYGPATVVCSAELVKKQTPVESAVAVVSVQDSFQIEPLAPSVFAAIARDGSQATTNALFVIGSEYVVAAGAHMSKPVINDLHKAIAAFTKAYTAK